MDCIFCKLAQGEIPTDVLYEDEEIFVFTDQNPQAPVHYLAIPKKHIASLNEADADDAALLGRLLLRIRQIAEDEGFAADGYRVVNNIGQDGGQSVAHIHFHVLAGRSLQWPPG